MTRLWHGTNQTFARFDRAFLGLHTQNDASRTAFYFSEGPTVAWDYAEAAARNLVPDQAVHEARVRDLLDRAARAEKARDFRLAERLTLKAEEVETAALQAPPANATLLLCEVDVGRVFRVEGCQRSALIDAPEILRKARDEGYDTVMFEEIWDTPTGVGADTHYAVFDPGRITILDRFFSLESAIEAAPSPHDAPEPAF